MGNTVGGEGAHEHGQEVICEARSHVLNYELAMMAWFAGAWRGRLRRRTGC